MAGSGIFPPDVPIGGTSSSASVAHRSDDLVATIAVRMVAEGRPAKQCSLLVWHKSNPDDCSVALGSWAESRISASYAVRQNSHGGRRISVSWIPALDFYELCTSKRHAALL